MRPRDHRLRLGLMAGLLGSALLLGACTREPGATETPSGARPSASPVRSASPVSAPSARPSTAPSTGPSSVAPQPSAAASSAPPASAAPPSASTAAGQKYVVEPGDTLGTIAEQFGVTIQQLIDANKLSNPDLLTVGQELIIPAR